MNQKDVDLGIDQSRMLTPHQIGLLAYHAFMALNNNPITEAAVEKRAAEIEATRPEKPEKIEEEWEKELDQRIRNDRNLPDPEVLKAMPAPVLDFGDNLIEMFGEYLEHRMESNPEPPMPSEDDPDYAMYQDLLEAGQAAAASGWHVPPVQQVMLAVNPDDTSEVWAWYHAEREWRRNGDASSPLKELRQIETDEDDS